MRYLLLGCTTLSVALSFPAAAQPAAAPAALPQASEVAGECTANLIDFGARLLDVMEGPKVSVQEKKAAENVMRQVTFGLGFFMGVIRGQSPSGSIREVIITGNTALGAKSAEQNQAMTKTCLAVSRAAGAEMKGLNAGAK